MRLCLYMFSIYPKSLYDKNMKMKVDGRMINVILTTMQTLKFFIQIILEMFLYKYFFNVGLPKADIFLTTSMVYISVKFTHVTNLHLGPLYLSQLCNLEFATVF